MSIFDLPNDGSSVTLGRARTNTIALPTDQAVSANHAELAPMDVPTPGGADGTPLLRWCVRDLGSSNGTALRLSTERKPSRPFAIRPGHRLTLGSGPKSSELLLARFRRGIAERKGRRPTMEDASVACDALPAAAGYEASVHRVSFYAVFDGHAGAEASAFCKVQMHRHLLSHLSKRIDARRAAGESDSGESDAGGGESDAGGGEGGGGEGMAAGVEDLAGALTDAFASTDAAFLDASNSSAGTTAIVAVVTPTHVLVANCGDSRAYVWRAGKVLRMSVDHKPDRIDEAARITAAGGWVSHGRVLHTLAVSRALGDRDFKLHPRSAAASLPFKAPLVSAEPELRVCRAQEGDELLLACDGLWDVLTPEAAFEYLHAHGAADNPQRAVQELVRAADEEYHSSDNITAVYVRLAAPDQ